MIMKNIRNIRNGLFAITLLIFTTNMAMAQCDLTVSQKIACRGTSIAFSIPGSTTFSSILWEFGDGKTSVQNVNNVSYIYDTFGTFQACVTLYNSDMTIKCGPSCVTINVYDKPNAGLILPLTTIMCFETNRFCFTDLSKPGKNNTPISSYLWDFGNGDTSTIKDPCYSYPQSGVYSILLTVTDTNKCWDTASKVTSIVVLPKLNPRFQTTFKIGCPETPVKFTNQTDTNGKCITEWIWDYGDGTRDTFTSYDPNSWTHIYKKDGTFNPKLIVKTCHGCVDSLIKFSGAKNIFYYFDIKKSESGPICWQDNSLCFAQKPRPNAYYWLWNFDDPPSQLLNTNDEDWEPCHHYTAPGVYHITLKIWEPNCIRDTVFCTYIPLKGPQAIINMPSPPFPPNNQLQAKPIPAIAWHSASTRCWNPNNDPINYATRAQVPKYQTGTITKYCKSLLDSANFDTTYKPYPCPLGNTIATGMTFPLLSPPVSSTPVYDSIQETNGAWTPGQPLPPGILNGNVVYRKTGSVNYQTMHDTDLYIHNCHGPNYVRFTNNSYKYRMYYAIDNHPFNYFPYPTKQAEMKFDECYNPSYPWASDSMLYFWSFADGTAKPCTSTVQKPDINCMYSTEVAPWHLYKEDGCYSVTLTVIDTITACTSEASVNIVMEPPWSGWDTTNYGKMERALNKMLPERIADPTKRRYNGMWKGSDPYMDFNNQLISPRTFSDTTVNPFATYSMRRGVRLNGVPCVGNNYPQVPSFQETRPTCARQFWWMVFDSNSRGFGSCDTPTVKCTDITYLDFDNNGIKESVQKHQTITCQWVDMITFMMMGNQWIYGKGGWKTLGLIIKTGDCFDTFWYHNYKYVADLNFGFNISDPKKYNYVRLPDNNLQYQTGKYPRMNYTAQEHYKICPNSQAILTIADTNQVGITQFKFFIDKFFPGPSPQWPSVHMEDSAQKTIDTVWKFDGSKWYVHKVYKRDTIYYMCHKDSFLIDPFTNKKVYTQCFTYPDFTKGGIFVKTEWQNITAQGYIPIDTFPQLTLRDSFFMKQAGAPLKQRIEPDWSLTIPGKYYVTATIRNVYGCASGGSAQIVVGHYADYEADDRIICYEGGGDTVTFKHTVRYFWIKIFPFDPDLNPNEYWVDPTNSLGLFDPAYGTRTGAPTPPSHIEKVEWDFGDGTGWHRNPNLTDEIKWVFNKPQDYTIKMRTTDSNGCVQVLERKAYIKVIGIVANFDTAASPEVCAPQPVKFLDKSIGLNIYKYIYNSQGQIIDSTKVDSVVYWKWDFYDGIAASKYSYLKDPVHTYTKNGIFNVRLLVRMSNGCMDTIEKPNYISILGPKPKFWLYKNGEKVYSDTICEGEYVVVLDSSKDVTGWQFVKGDQSNFSDTVRPSNHQWAIQYLKAGTYRLYLNGTAKVFFPIPAPGYWGSCTQRYGDTTVHPDDPYFTVVVNGIPKSEFSGDTLICDGTTARFNDNSATEYPELVWNFGDGTDYYKSVPKATVTHTYSTMTSYDTTYTIELDGRGVKCPDKIKKATIRVMKADATIDIVEDKMPVYTFANNCLGGNKYKWTVTGTSDDGTKTYNEVLETDSKDKYVFNFGNYIGTYQVCLWTWIKVGNYELGCLDTQCITVKNFFEVELDIPNVFTPGKKDGVNDKFVITSKSVEYWDLIIYNRWGEKMFQTDDPENHWDGTNMNTGKPAPASTYYYVLNYQLRGEKRSDKSGTVTLIR